MTSPESLTLIRRAKDGDREAWQALCLRYYPKWVRKVHGRLGAGLRELVDTQDLVQSAVADALRDIQSLRSDASFYSWVSAILRRKVADKRRSVKGKKAGPLDEATVPGRSDSGLDADLLGGDGAEYVRVLDAILSLFPAYPGPMSALYLKYFEKLDVEGLGNALGTSERSVHRLLKNALALLRTKLGRGA